MQHVKYWSGWIYEARSNGLKSIIIHSLSCRGMLSKSNELGAAMWKVRTWWFFIFTSPFSSTNEEFMPCEQLNISIQMWRDRFAMHYQQGYVKKKNRGWAMQTQFVTDVPHFQANHFSSQDNEEAPPQNTHMHAYKYTHTLSNTVHQLSSSCHESRQPGSGIYSQSIQNGPCHFYWISHQQKGQLRWWVLVGGQLKKLPCPPDKLPLQSVHCLMGRTVWDCTCRWHKLYSWDHVAASHWNSGVGSRIRWCLVCSDHFEGDYYCVIKTCLTISFQVTFQWSVYIPRAVGSIVNENRRKMKQLIVWDLELQS